MDGVIKSTISDIPLVCIWKVFENPPSDRVCGILCMLRSCSAVCRVLCWTLLTSSRCSELLICRFMLCCYRVRKLSYIDIIRVHVFVVRFHLLLVVWCVRSFLIVGVDICGRKQGCDTCPPIGFMPFISVISCYLLLNHSTQLTVTATVTQICILNKIDWSVLNLFSD